MTTAPEDRSAEYLLVRELRQQANKISTTISENTRKDYEAKYQRMMRMGTLPENAGTKRGYYAYRAALLYGTAVLIRETLKARDKAIYGSLEWQTSMETLRQCQGILNRYPPDSERQHYDQGSSSFTWRSIRTHKTRTVVGWSATVASKKRIITRVRKIPEWRSKLFTEITAKHKNAAAVAILTGCRPSEIARGVKVELVQTQSGQRLLFTIPGSKLTKTSGQPERKISVLIVTDEGRYLAQHAALSTVTVTTHPANLCAAFIKAGRRAFPHLQETVSPYVLRHALACDLKAGGINPENIAQILGHQASESQQAYGFAVCASGDVHIDGVWASVPVRDTQRNPRNYLAHSHATPSPC